MLDLPEWVIRELFNKLSKARWYRDSIKACCPFHDEDTPSFGINEMPDGRIGFYCFGCGEGGIINRIFRELNIDYYIKYDTEFLPKKLAEKISPYDRYRVNTLGFPKIYDYYLSRGISEDICNKFDFRFDLGDNCAVMPVYTKRRYLGWIKRHTRGEIRYEIEIGMPVGHALWGYDQVDPEKETFIMEGIIDAAIFWSQGHQAIALCNKTYKHKIPLLRELRKPVMVPDNYDPLSLETFNDLRKEIGGILEYIPLPAKDAGEYIFL